MGMLTFAKAVGIKNVDAQMTSLKMDDKNAWISDDKCAKGAAPAKKDDKKPAAPAKKDDKKPAAPAKKDDKKPAPAKKDDKKPAAKPAKGAWDMKAKIGDETAWQSWDAYIAMPQTPVDKNMKFTWNEKCNVASWKAFLKPVVFGKLTAKPREFASFMNMFEILKFLN